MFSVAKESAYFTRPNLLQQCTNCCFRQKQFLNNCTRIPKRVSGTLTDNNDNRRKFPPYLQEILQNRKRTARYLMEISSPLPSEQHMIISQSFNLWKKEFCNISQNVIRNPEVSSAFYANHNVLHHKIGADMNTDIRLISIFTVTQQYSHISRCKGTRTRLFPT